MFSLVFSKLKRLRRHVVALCNYLKGDVVRWGQPLFTGRKLQGRFRLDNRKNFFIERVVKHWNGWLREVDSPSLKVFRGCVEVAPGSMV